MLESNKLFRKKEKRGKRDGGTSEEKGGVEKVWL